MLNLNSLLLGTQDPETLAAFYEKVFQKKPDMAEKGWYGFLVGSCFLSIGSHDKVKGKSAQPERVMFNLETNDVKGEFERIKALGTTVIAAPYHMGNDATFSIATLADPDGNYFQLVTPWNADK